MTENPLQLLMNPKSVAVVGAGNDFTKMGTIQALSIIKDGYRGKFYPIHLKEKNVLGLNYLILLLFLHQIAQRAHGFGGLGYVIVIIAAGFITFRGCLFVAV